MNKIETKGTLVLTDPCYKKIEKGINCFIHVKPGKWNCDYEREPVDDRISSIILIHEDFDFDEIKKKLKEKDVEGQIAVDSGTASIMDEELYHQLINSDDRKRKTMIDAIWEKTDFFCDNPNYKPYLETNSFKELCERCSNEFKNYLNGFKITYSPDLILKGLKSSWGLSCSDEFEEFINSIQKEYNIKEKTDIQDNLYEIAEQYTEESKKLSIENDRTKRIYNPKADVYENSCYVSSSGYGDGFYDYFIYKIDDEIVGIMIIFIEIES